LKNGNIENGNESRPSLTNYENEIHLLMVKLYYYGAGKTCVINFAEEV